MYGSCAPFLQLAFFFLQPGDSAGKDSVQESFLKLVNAHFVERCPVPEPVLEQATKQEGPAKKRGAKSAKVML